MRMLPTILQALGLLCALYGAYLLLPLAWFALTVGVVVLTLGVLAEVISLRKPPQEPSKPKLVRKDGA
jgi:hypothetical protein